MTKQRFCKDCRYFYHVKWWRDRLAYASTIDWIFSMFEEREQLCIHEKSLHVVSRVNGTTKWLSCDLMRSDYAPLAGCGDAGRLFEPKNKDTTDEQP